MIMRRFIFVLLFFIGFSLSAQENQSIDPEDYENQQVEMADQMRQSGKIYVVVAVIVVIFLGIVLYTISLDRKISKLEKEYGENIEEK